VRRIDQAALAGLLHDVGKFAQRASMGGNWTCEQKERFLPKRGMGYSHYHALWSYTFLCDHMHVLPEPKERFPDSEETLLNAVGRHHRPETVLEHIVAEADCIASGHDRRERSEDDLQGDGSLDPSLYKKARLRSIFSDVNLSVSAATPGASSLTQNTIWVYPLKPLVPTPEAIFPVEAPGEDRQLTPEYKELWKTFTKEFSLPARVEVPALRSNPLLAYQRAAYLLEKYTWCMPSSTVDEPDVSLWDHARVTACLAACLSMYHEETGRWNRTAVRNRDEQKFVLVGGDLSGIQQSLFSFAPGRSKGAAKTLRARSFLFSLLCRAVTKLIECELGVHPAQTIFEGGGRFLMILPNIPRITQGLLSVQEKVDRWCLNEFHGQLSLNLDWSVTFSASDLLHDSKSGAAGFVRLMDRWTTAMEEAKRRKLARALASGDRWLDSFTLDEEYDKFSTEGVCVNCGREPGGVPEGRDVEEQENIGRRCAKLRSLGRILVKDPVVVWEGLGQKKSESYRAALLLDFFEGNVHARVLDPANFNLCDLDDLVLAVDEINSHLAEMGQGTQASTRDRSLHISCRLVANHVPVFRKSDVLSESNKRADRGEPLVENQPLPFSEIAARRKEGSELLGLVKGDVDRLGQVFSRGLPPGRWSLSRYATLSRFVDLFFSGYCNTLLKLGSDTSGAESSQFANTYTVYAGGDDFFFVADWDTAINLARKLRRDFESFVCKNSSEGNGITLSVGIAFAKPHQPIRIAAERAERQLSRAKGAGRNRLAIFDHTVPWSIYERVLRDYANHLNNFLNHGLISSAFLYRLLVYHRMHEESAHDPALVIYRALLAYDIRRNVLSRKDKSAQQLKVAEEQLTRLYDLRKQDRQLMDNLSVPVQEVLYRHRTV